MQEGTGGLCALITDRHLLDRSCSSKPALSLLAACWISEAIKEATQDPTGTGFCPQLPSQLPACSSTARAGHGEGQASLLSFMTWLYFFLLQGIASSSPCGQQVTCAWGAQDTTHHPSCIAFSQCSFYSAFLLATVKMLKELKTRFFYFGQARMPYSKTHNRYTLSLVKYIIVRALFWWTVIITWKYITWRKYSVKLLSRKTFHLNNKRIFDSNSEHSNTQSVLLWALSKQQEQKTLPSRVTSLWLLSKFLSFLSIINIIKPICVDCFQKTEKSSYVLVQPEGKEREGAPSRILCNRSFLCFISKKFKEIQLI